jgi:tetratricopeptide (TPR) repeat protein
VSNNAAQHMNRLQTVHVWLSVALSLAGPLVGLTAGQPTQSTGQPAELLSPAEFPDYDAGVWREQRNGLATKSASSRLTKQPDSPEIAELLQQNRVDDALRVLRSIVDKYPQNIPRAFQIVSEESPRFWDKARGYPDSLQELVDAARKQLARLPREEAARAERRLLLLDRQPSLAKRPEFADQLRTFVQQYAGTQTALLTEIDVIEFGLPIRQRLEALDRFVRDHPGTIAAAKALNNKGFQLGSSNVYPEIEARGADPTPRFFQVLEIVRELESGRYPSCEWVERAPMLISTFFAHDPTYAPENIDRQLDAYKEFAKTHFAVADQFPLNNGAGYIITTKMFDLFKRNGEGVAGVERVFTELEREIRDVAAVQYARAVFYVRSMNWEPARERSAIYQKAIESLTRLQAQGTGLYQRKALATLASLYFSERDYASARDHFKKYLSAYPDTTWAWVAALRIGQSSEALGDWRAAVDAHLAAASKYTSVPFARVLGHAYAGRGYEALGQFNSALREYQTALADWDKDYGPAYSLHVTYNPRPNEPLRVRDDPSVTSQALPGRIAQLKNSVSLPGGTLLEHGRWLVGHGRHAEALVPLEQLLTRYRQSSAVPEARYLVHRARLGSALELADVQNTRRDGSAALGQLEIIARDPYDFGVCAAKIAKASILWKNGASAEAEALMVAALREWNDQQSPQRQRPRENIARDIADIRSLVIRPQGDGILNGFAGNTFSRRRPSVSFVIVNPDVSVKFSNTENTRQSVYQTLPGVDQLLFLNGEQQAILTTIVAKLGGGEPTQDRTVASTDILALWNKFFPTERRFGGVAVDTYPRITFETYPIITDIEFLDSERTKAVARIVVGSQGGTVVLEKERGIWTAKGLVNTWIS